MKALKMYNEYSTRHNRKNLLTDLFAVAGSFWLVFVLFLFGNPSVLEARVKGGTCADCHTMHNSQNNSPMVFLGTGAAWTSGQMGGTGSTTHSTTDIRRDALLVTDCVGCHSNSTADTIVTVGSLRIPIVYNTVQPANPLAGGNFYWARSGGDPTKGHNVLGISGVDPNHDEAPGTNYGGCFGSANCHTSLAVSTAANYSQRPGGCQGCHTPKHHGKPVAALGIENADSGWYRYLGAKDHGEVSPEGDPVIGIEDPNWEQTPDASHHNVYYAGLNQNFPAGIFSDPGETPQGIGRFCAGCHHNFHAHGKYKDAGAGGFPNGSGELDDPWIRHPSDKSIPNSGEYTGLSGVAYNPTIPVGVQELTAGVVPSTIKIGEALVDKGDKVFCLSCHRAHGSEYSDMLRWNYSGGGMSHSGSSTDGCFFCHREKDDP